MAIFFLTVPVAFIQSLSNLERLAHLHHACCRPLVANRAAYVAAWLGIIEGYLPSLALMAVMLTLPVVLLAALPACRASRRTAGSS